MTREEIFATVRDTMVESFELDPAAVRAEARLYEDLDLDSIDAIDMAVKVQEITGRRIEESALRKLRTVGDVVTAIDELLNTPKA